MYIHFLAFFDLFLHFPVKNMHFSVEITGISPGKPKFRFHQI